MLRSTSVPASTSHMLTEAGYAHAVPERATEWCRVTPDGFRLTIRHDLDQDGSLEPDAPIWHACCERGGGTVVTYLPDTLAVAISKASDMAVPFVPSEEHLAFEMAIWGRHL